MTGKGENTRLRPIKSIYFQKMEDSEQQTQVMTLGKTLVKELNLEDSTDTLSRWMAHYLAEKIRLTQTPLPLAEKEAAEKICFETILALWKHRWMMPAGKRPLEAFEPIFEVLQRLDPNRSQPFYYRVDHQQWFEMGKEGQDNQPGSIGLDQAERIDKAARICIEEVLSQAAKESTNERIQAILENAVRLPESEDVQVIRILIKEDHSEVSEAAKKDAFEARYRREQLKERIQELEQFVQLGERILTSYRTEMDELARGSLEPVGDQPTPDDDSGSEDDTGASDDEPE
jgi:hypothetical protein